MDYLDLRHYYTSMSGALQISWETMSQWAHHAISSQLQLQEKMTEAVPSSRSSVSDQPRTVEGEQIFPHGTFLAPQRLIEVVFERADASGHSCVQSASPWSSQLF